MTASDSSEAAATPPEEAVHVALPPPELAAQVVCCVRRELRGAPRGGTRCAAPSPVSAGAAAAARHVPGDVPSNVYACLNLIVAGDVDVLVARPLALPRAFVTGPFRAPLPTRATVPLLSVSLVLHPWLLADWFGLAPSRMVDAVRSVPVEESARHAWTAFLCARLLEGATSAQEMEAALASLVHAPARPTGRPPAGAGFGALLLEHGSVREAARAASLGERQFERLFVRDHGIAPKRWLRIKRFERGLSRLAHERASRPASLGDLAADAGYADQGHMTREFRAIGGQTPARLRAALAEHSPGYWAFRPARVGFVQYGESSGE